MNFKKIIYNRPHLVEDYFFCRRRFWLHAIYIYEYNHPLLMIGKKYHEFKENDINKYPVKVDKINWDKKLLIEYKKKDFGLPEVLQTYFYLKLLNEEFFQNINKAKIISIELNKSRFIKYPNKELDTKIQDMFKDISNLSFINIKRKKNFCKNCSLFDYCWC
jgi:CRISPR/Cas system-associated exonuclease Cas4 (RecB family)